MEQKKAVPFVKWAGGKRQLLTQIKERMPAKYHAYYEPFVGGGALYFDLLPSEATINDMNAALMNTYRQIRDFPKEFYQTICVFDKEIQNGKKEYYYQKRELYNNKLIKNEYDIELAALFVFLNKHCFNGLYRVNGKGLFNVPYNQSVRNSCTKETILAAAENLQKVNIYQGDFQRICEMTKKGDFVFLDSPYAPLNPTSFEAYTKEGFDIESHRRLAKVFKQMTEKECYCMLTNHNTEFIRDLYKEFNCEVIDVKRMINSDASNRVGKEIIITNY